MSSRRSFEYNGEACWQYQVRIDNLEKDLAEAGFESSYTSSLRVSDFNFGIAQTESEKRKFKRFIERHEWLGTISQYTTHWFGCYHKGHLAGVILFNMPNAFSKLLGDDTKNLERLISRGACISWSPKNLASAFLMWCIDYMAKNTQYRVFTAYSDPEAREIGTIYQACNFFYLGQQSGGSRKYINPYTGKVVSDRFFRQRTAFKKYAKELGIKWKRGWTTGCSIRWDLMPSEYATALREASKRKQKESVWIESPPKHKYAFVIGSDKRETKYLRGMFLKKNKTYPYPKDRLVLSGLHTSTNAYSFVGHIIEQTESPKTQIELF